MTRSRKGHGIQHLYYQYREYHRTIRRGDTVCDEPLTSIFCLCWDHIRIVRARYGGTEEVDIKIKGLRAIRGPLKVIYEWIGLEPTVVFPLLS